MKTELRNLITYLWQVVQILGVALTIITIVLVVVRIWNSFGLLP